MFRVVCDPSSGSIEMYLTEIRSGSLMFVVCLVGVWQRTLPNTDQAHDKHQCTLRISVKYSSILPDDGSHTIRNMLE